MFKKILTALVIVFSLFLASCGTWSTESTENGKSKEKESIINVPLGEKVELATIDLTINSFKGVNNFNTGYKIITPKEGAKFILADVIIKNTTKEPYFETGKGINIKDTQGRYFTTQNLGIVMKNGFGNMQPGISEKGILLYEVPIDAEGYTIEIQNSETNQKYNIN